MFQLRWSARNIPPRRRQRTGVVIAFMLVAPALAQPPSASTPPARPRQIAADSGFAPRSARQELVGIVNTGWVPEPLARETSPGQYDGFMVDVIKEAAAAVGLTVRFESRQKMTDIRREIDSGGADVLVGAAVARRDRDVLAFTEPLVVSPTMLYVRTGQRPPQSIADLAGTRVAVTIGSLAHERLGAQEDLTLVQTSGDEESFRQLVRGEVDFVATGALTGRYTLERTHLTGVTAHPFPGGGNWRPYALAVSTRNTDLLADLNDGLSILRRTGRFDELYDAHIGRYQPAERVRPFWIRALPAIVGVGAAGALLGAGWFYTLRRELKRRTRQLRQTEEKYGRFFANSHDAIIVYDHQTRRILDANPAAHALYGRTDGELVGMSLESLRADDDSDIRESSTQTTLGAVDLRRHRRKDGSIIYVEINASSTQYEGHVAILLFIRDVSERIHAQEQARRLEEQVQQAERFKSLAVVAGGVAHDFNNLLVGIMGGAELARAALPSGPADTWLAQIIAASKQASDLTQQLLAYAGDARIVTHDVDLAELVQEVAEVLRPLLPATARVEFALSAPGVATVRADAAQLRQAVMNLIINAADALPSSKGTIRMSTGRRSLDAQALAGVVINAAEPGDFAFVTVADTGCGMDAATLREAFLPFYSTKGTGRGLGLAVVHGVVQRHGGAVEAASAIGAGSTITLLIPYAEPRTASPAAPATGATRLPSSASPSRPASLETLAPRPAGAEPQPAGSAAHDPVARPLRHVLIIDDDRIVRDVAGAILESAGWKPLVADSGNAAIDLLERGSVPECILLDITMPGMTGHEVLDRVRARWPKIPVVIMSGYDIGRIKPTASGAAADASIAKPFLAEDLISTVERVAARTAPAMRSDVLPPDAPPTNA